MRSTVAYVGACLLAALAPLMHAAGPAPGRAVSHKTFPGWPSHFEGRALTELPLSERERRFGGDFPGRIARFTDGEREIIFRWVTEPTRKLHPASDCFAGLGYRVRPLPLRIDENGERWGTFTASRRNEALRVYERIYAEGGGSWADASSWYWAATGSSADERWWAVTVAERTAAP